MRTNIKHKIKVDTYKSDVQLNSRKGRSFRYSERVVVVVALIMERLLVYCLPSLFGVLLL